MSAVAVPGLVLGIGLLRTYYDVKLPISGEPLATFWGMLVIAYAARRLPYALSAANAALQQFHEVSRKRRKISVQGNSACSAASWSR